MGGKKHREQRPSKAKTEGCRNGRVPAPVEKERGSGEGGKINQRNYEISNEDGGQSAPFNQGVIA